MDGRGEKTAMQQYSKRERESRVRDREEFVPKGEKCRDDTVL